MPTTDLMDWWWKKISYLQQIMTTEDWYMTNVSFEYKISYT